MSAYTDYEKNEGHLGRRYRAYERVYNETFAADPDPSLRRFDELAGKDSQQWKRLEIYRGNDRDAQHAHLSHPGNPLFDPTAKEAASWAANQEDKWRIEREPAFGQHPDTHNKWLDLTPRQRNAEGAQKFLSQVDARHAGSKEGSALPGLAVAEFEARVARRSSAQAAEATQASEHSQQAETAQVPWRSRLSIASFGSAAEAVQSLHSELAIKSDGELMSYRQQVATEHQAAGLGSLADGQVRVMAFSAHQEVREQQRSLRAHEVATHQHSQRRSHSQ